MQYRISTRSGAPALPRIEDALTLLDPAAVLDLAPGGEQLRVSTCVAHGELLQVLHAAGYHAATDDVEQLPSECCGGCGG